VKHHFSHFLSFNNWSNATSKRYTVF